MAGDWIKMLRDLDTAPEVISLASQLDTSRDFVVGALYRLWCWADVHTEDGGLEGVPLSFIDQFIGVSDFGNALVNVGWLESTPNGLIIPKFGRHMGQSAKKRVLATERMRRSRDDRSTVTKSCDKNDTRRALPFALVRKVQKRDDHTCVYCGDEAKGIDHMIPSARGGEDNIENLATCCLPCNQEKGARKPEEWELLPTFLAEGVSYNGEKLVTHLSQNLVTKTALEKRREEKSNNNIITEQEKYFSGSSATVDTTRAFLVLWDIWPAHRRMNKRQAEAVWDKAINREPPETILAAGKAFAKSPKGTSEFCTSLSKWLERDGWADDPASWQQGKQPPKKTDPAEDASRVLYREFSELRRTLADMTVDSTPWTTAKARIEEIREILDT